MVSPEGLDRGTLYWFQYQFRPHTPWLEPVMRGVTVLGDRLVLITVGAVAVAQLLARRQPRRAGFFGLAVLGGWVLVESLKLLVGRPRPDVLASPPSGDSFPSGHALLAMPVYFGLALVVVRSVRRPGWRVALMMASLLLVFLIGFSRLYLCVHYLTDVVAGWGFGLAWTLTCHWMEERQAAAG